MLSAVSAPAQPTNGGRVIPWPRTQVQLPPGGWACDETDPTSSQQSCNNSIKKYEGELRRLHRSIETGALDGSSPDVQQRISFYQRDLDRMNEALRFIELHPDKFGAGLLTKHAEADSFLLTDTVRRSEKRSVFRHLCAPQRAKVTTAEPA